MRAGERTKIIQICSDVCIATEAFQEACGHSISTIEINLINFDFSPQNQRNKNTNN